MLALILLSMAAPTDLTQFTKPQTISGVWFTNFENSRFVQCDGIECDNWASKEAATIECGPGVCDALDSMARKLTNQREEVAPDGLFQIRFVGRVSLAKHEPRFLGDGTYTVLVERVLEVKSRDNQGPSRE